MIYETLTLENLFYRLLTTQVLVFNDLLPAVRILSHNYVFIDEDIILNEIYHEPDLKVYKEFYCTCLS